MRFVVVLLLVTLATANPVDKRFLERIVDAFKHTWDAAKSEFDHLTAGINVDLHSVVNKLIPLIDSAPTEIACKRVCVGSAATVLGPAAPLAHTVCDPACKA
ncbi:hypothetical protein BaRGS_00000018 [Batillaria attramentaria]|uniref:Uncharacterized protein n=1 Tax=Batillaria attramentaria TaxID=370345 RepID=A0ABD0MAT1_9CAEN